MINFLDLVNDSFKLGVQTDYGVVLGKEIVSDNILKVKFIGGNKAYFQDSGWDNLVEI